jgi:hypothetical protein
VGHSIIRTRVLLTLTGALLLVSAELTANRKDSLLELRQVVFDRPPDDLAVHTLVVVTQNVTDAGNVLPSNILVGRFQLMTEVPARLRNDFDSPFDCRTQQPGLLKIEKGLVAERRLDFLRYFPAYRECEATGYAMASENPDRLGLNPFTYQRMQTRPSGEINIEAHPVLEQPPCRYQVKGVESTLGVIVKKEIEIASRSGLIAGGRTIQIERRGTPFLQGAGERF